LPKTKSPSAWIYLLLNAAFAAAQTPTTTTLSSSPNPANLGQRVTLTATVTAGATGKVTFYDGATILGISPIFGSQATWTTVLLPSGARSLRAYYQGNAGHSPSSSAIVTEAVHALPSLGLHPSVTYPAGVGPFSAAMGDFNGDGKQDLAVADYGPALTVLLNTSNGKFQATTYNFPTDIFAVVTGDFDGDGKPDLVIAGYNAFFSLMLGKGDGTFQAATSVSLSAIPNSVAVGDFNGDGKADLVFAGNGVLLVLLGNGDGTFQASASNMDVIDVSSIAVADFNGDGKADLALADGPNVSTLLGNGNGTFAAPVNYPFGSFIEHVVASDLNGDGKLDLAAVDSTVGLGVLLGKGDGTFESAVTFGGSRLMYSFAVGDINGDGKQDLVTAQNYGSGEIFYGNGDGTFQAPINFPVSITLYAEIVGDFNGDGISDVAVLDYNNGTITIYFGGAGPDLAISVNHGNGLTQGQAGAAYNITVSNVGDFTTVSTVSVVDSLPPGLTATAIAGSGWTCNLASLSCNRADSLAPGASFPVIRITVDVASGLAGKVTNTAVVSGGGDANSSNNTATDTTVSRTPTTVSLTAAPNPSTLGQIATLTAAVAPGGTGNVTFYDAATVLGIAATSGGQAPLATNLLLPGAHFLTARYDGDANFGPSLSSVFTQTIASRVANGFQPRLTFPVTEPYAVAVADFNRDGKPDIVTANGVDGGISVMLGDGDGTFQTAVNYLMGFTTYTTDVKVGDFNGDGIPDVLIYAETYGFYVFLGNGDGTFRIPVRFATSTSYPYYVIADFDGDGRLDIAATTGSTTSETELDILLGNGDGTFRPGPVETGLPFFPQLFVADVNLDGKPDLIASASTSVLILLGHGDGTFQTGSIYNLYPYGGTSIGVGDFNGDGKPDIVQISPAATEVILGNGDGTFGPAIGTVSGSTSGGSLLVGDFNGDGKMDVLISSDFALLFPYVNNLWIELGNGDGTFQSPVILVTDGYSIGHGVAEADVNGDGFPDLVVANAFTELPNLTGEPGRTVTVLLGGQFPGLIASLTHNGPITPGQTKTYTITVTNPALTATSAPASVSILLAGGLTATALSGSGWNCSLAALTCSTQSTVSAYSSFPLITLTVVSAGKLAPSTLTSTASVTYNGSTATASDRTPVVAPTTTLLTASSNPSMLGQEITLTATVSSGAGAVVFRDDANILGTARLTGNQAIFKTRLIGAGSHKLTAVYSGDSTYGASMSNVILLTVNSALASGFTTALSLGAGSGLVQLLTSDLNGDGKADLITVNNKADTVSVFFGNGDGTFQSKKDYPVGMQPTAAVVADFNGDGAPDLAVANFQSNTVLILLNQGGGTFASGVSLIAYAPTGLIAADLNGDGKVDLAVTQQVTAGSIFFGNGDGTFQPALTAPISAVLAAGDFNNDRVIDLVSSNYVELGNGDGTFGNAVNVPGNESAWAIGDLNGDGKEDLIGTSPFNGVAVYLGNGDGTFKTALNYATGYDNMAAAITLADINGDGRLDVIVTNSDTKTISVLLGNGDGTLRPAVPYDVALGPQSIVTGDFNGDGRTDLAIANANGTITILLGARYVPTSAPATVTYSITNNGDQDLSVYYPGAGGYQYSLLSAGNGTYTSIPTPAIGAFDTVMQGDFNGDSKSDMLFYNSATGALKIGLGDGTGHFSYTTSNISPGYQIQRGDFNGDGKTDLLLYRPSDGAAYLALSNGDGMFTFIAQVFSPGFTSIAVADYNADGFSDIIAYNNQTPPYNAYLLLGDGAGHFTGSSLFFGGGYTVLPADLNADGKSDFILYRPSDGTVYVAISNGTSFTYHYLLYSPGFTAFKIGDVNGDGFPDLVLYNSVNAIGYLLLGDGTGNFPSGSSLFFGPGMDFVDLRDFNGDGKQDVIIYRSADGTSYTGISNGTGFAYTYNYFGPGRIVAQ